MSSDRRGFLRQLAALPLIGGSVTLIGGPTAVAEPVSDALIDRYIGWLSVELGEALVERTGRLEPVYKNEAMVWRREWCRDNRKLNPRPERGLFLAPPSSPPSTRAAIVLSTVGCDWRECLS